MQNQKLQKQIKRLGNDIKEVDKFKTNIFNDCQKLLDDGMKMFNELVAANIDPEDAYMQVLSHFESEITLPTIYKVVQPTSIKILEPPKGTVKDPAKWFEDKRLQVLENYKNNSIDFNLYQADVNAINIVEDYYKLLEGIGKQEFAFSSERKPPKEAEKVLKND